MSEWIPVNESPKVSGRYLVSGKDEIWICEFLDFGMVKGWANNAKNPCVEAWRELPEPYNADKECD